MSGGICTGFAPAKVTSRSVSPGVAKWFEGAADLVCGASGQVMNRREFLAYGALGGGASIVLGSAEAQTATRTYELFIEPADVEMIDGTIVYMLLFFGGPPGMRAPRPVLRAVEGETVVLRIVNNAPEAHRFQVPGVTGATTTNIAPGQRREIRFTAPVGGTYIYLDPLQAPLYRLVGLHGAFVVTPRNNGVTPAGSPTPYSTTAQTAAVRAVFDAMGTRERFAGGKWDPTDIDRDKIWVFSQTDPALNKRVELRQTVDLTTLAANFKPRYFTINGRSGFDLDEDPTVRISGYVGQPTLIRTINTGLATHAPHIHGNHVFELSGNTTAGAVAVRGNVYERDVWMLAPLDRKDVLLPFEIPPDIPREVWPPVQEPWPLRYVMHCHTEMSQTAGGGNYPQGAVCHWELLGPQRPA